MKTYFKTLWRMFGRHATRLLSIILMVLVSVGFISGIGSATDKINYSLTDYYKDRNVSDFIIKSKSSSGFSEDDVNALKNKFGAQNVNCGLSMDVRLTKDGESRLTRLYFLDFSNWSVNVPDVIEGEKCDAEQTAQIYAERADNRIKGYSVGEEIELDLNEILKQSGGAASLPFEMKRTVKVSGVVQSPLTFASDGEFSYENGEIETPDTIGAANDLITLDDILYIPVDLFTFGGRQLLPTGDIFVAAPDRGIFNAFSAKYKSFATEEEKNILGLLKTPEGGAEGLDVKVITLYDNYSFVSLKAYSDKVAGIAVVLMVAFILVTGLVVLSTMTRLLEEERSQIACLKTLGYSPFKIIFKYLLFAVIGTGIGGAGAYFVGLGVARLLYTVFNYSFAMPPISSSVALLFYLITFLVIVAAAVTATLAAGRKMTSAAPATLLRPKPPRAGRKVILEKIPIIWNNLSFKYKSTTRNVLRYRSRFLMTVIAVAVSTALILAGLALLDLCLFGAVDSLSVMSVALVVVFFAGLLTMVVIYTLTNINVSERNRELATLQVLGYFDKEVAGYISREVYIDTVVGIIFGYPLSTLIMWVLFGIMEMGSIGGVSWFWWIVAPVIVLCFTFLVMLVLRRKIVGIDMNESLKAIE